MQERDLKLLVANKAPLNVVVTRTDDGFTVRVNDQPLGSARQDVRPFAKLDTVARMLAGVGVSSFTVRTTA